MHNSFMTIISQVVTFFLIGRGETKLELGFHDKGLVSHTIQEEAGRPWCSLCHARDRHDNWTSEPSDHLPA